ncbi:unnamed protein product, partial [Brassica rapa subsp. trilocularis]
VSTLGFLVAQSAEGTVRFSSKARLRLCRVRRVSSPAVSRLACVSVAWSLIRSRLWLRLSPCSWCSFLSSSGLGVSFIISSVLLSAVLVIIVVVCVPASNRSAPWFSRTVHVRVALPRRGVFGSGGFSVFLVCAHLPSTGVSRLRSVS